MSDPVPQRITDEIVSRALDEFVIHDRRQSMRFAMRRALQRVWPQRGQTPDRERAIETVIRALQSPNHSSVSSLAMSILDALDAPPAPEPQGLLTEEERKAVLEAMRVAGPPLIPRDFDTARAKIESPPAAPEQQALTAEEDRGWKPSDTPDPFLLRAADALYERCADLIRSHRVDARSPMGDALLDYRDVRDESAQRSIEGPPAPTITDEMIERAMLAAYDAAPQYVTESTGRRPRTYEECYGCSPLEHTDDVAEMRAALRAALGAD